MFPVAGGRSLLVRNDMCVMYCVCGNNFGGFPFCFVYQQDSSHIVMPERCFFSSPSHNIGLVTLSE